MAIDLKDITDRNAAVLVDLAMMGLTAQMPDIATARSLFQRMSLSLADVPSLMAEVDALARIRADIREVHCPENIDGRAYCAECSADGPRRLWPCKTWKMTER